jgi:hypothetical protein
MYLIALTVPILCGGFTPLALNFSCKTNTFCSSNSLITPAFSNKASSLPLLLSFLLAYKTILLSVFTAVFTLLYFVLFFL